MNGIERKLCTLSDGPHGETPSTLSGGTVAGGHPWYREPGPVRDDLARVQEGRLRARRFVGALMRDARLGRTVDARDACELVEELAATVSADHDAVLRLTDAGAQEEFTSVHSVNVCILALAFGMHLGLQKDELVHTGVGALLHDVGKARTPGRILQKAGALTPREAAIVQRHPEDGYEIMGASPHMPGKALDVIRLHHERVGGQGYPFGLSGDEIPWHVRIAIVADAYDTMTSDRPYRRARASTHAVRDLHNGAGDCFDAALVRQFTDWLSVRRVDRAPEAGSAIAAAAHRAGSAARRRPRRAIKPAQADIDLLQYAGG